MLLTFRNTIRMIELQQAFRYASDVCERLNPATRQAEVIRPALTSGGNSAIDRPVSESIELRSLPLS